MATGRQVLDIMKRHRVEAIVHAAALLPDPAQNSHAYPLIPPA